VIVAMATSPAAPGRPNEDFLGVIPSAAVLLDGAGILGTESICRHGVAWYAHRLGGAILGTLSRDDGEDLVGILGDGIERTTEAHSETCDVTDPSSPQATAAIFRLAGDRAEYLVLGDSFVVFEQVGAAPIVVSDDREVAVRRRLQSVLDGLVEGTPEYNRARHEYVEGLRANRNKAGGYWIAKDDPRAASHAVTGSLAIANLTGAAVVSNGVSRIVDRFGILDWQELLSLVAKKGPSHVIRRVRQAEGSDHDDATIAWCTWIR
jgi:hypothetical protein